MPISTPPVLARLVHCTVAALLLPVATVVAAAPAMSAHATTVSSRAVSDQEPGAARTAVRTSDTSGSIVFIKGRNVWIALGDGSHARKITKDGTKAHAYHSPSESDRGTIVVARGSKIIRMSQRGKVLNTINPPRLFNSAGEALDGAVNDVAISPNGKTIAWSFVRYSCPIGADCLTRYATGYTSATHRTHAGRSTYFRAASWITNTRTLQTGGYGSQVMLQDLTKSPRHWFDDHDYTFPSTDLADGELSRNGRWLAEIRGFKGTSSIAWYAVSGDARTGRRPSMPLYTCVTNGEAAHASPTWSPKSTALAWAGKAGIWIKQDVASCSSPQPTLVIRGGSAPDWSPARWK
ncbi:hypothetical protein [uncultured Friedmanniella sp.]|uniref:hypothetical protein n=1 Tax=uncultured Friedmanniella sp. TaxID=335381 RepID=UPI0035CA4B0C